MTISEHERGAATEPLIDTEHLRSLRDLQGDGDDIVGRLVKLYADQAPLQLEKLCSAADRGDAAQISASAHALRSMSANMGARRIFQICAEIEATPTPALHHAFDSSLKQALADTLAALKAAA